MKTSSMTFRLDKELKAKFDEIAKNNCLNKTAWFESKMKGYIKKEGINAKSI